MKRIGRDELVRRTSILENGTQPPAVDEVEALLTESAALMLALKAEIIRTQRKLEDALKHRSPTAATLDEHRTEVQRECEGVKAIASRLRSLHRATLPHRTASAA